MNELAMIAFVLATGVTVSGLLACGTAIVIGYPPYFAKPFVSRSHLFRSFLIMLVLGPAMFCGTMFHVWRQGALSGVQAIVAAATAFVWMLALGLIVVDTAHMVLAVLETV